jgi:hypothetical protein
MLIYEVGVDLLAESGGRLDLTSTELAEALLAIASPSIVTSAKPANRRLAATGYRLAV